MIKTTKHLNLYYSVFTNNSFSTLEEFTADSDPAVNPNPLEPEVKPDNGGGGGGCFISAAQPVHISIITWIFGIVIAGLTVIRQK